MAYDIVWSPEARNTYIGVLESINSQWSISEVKSFETHVNQVLELVRKFPEIYEYSDYSNAHRCVLSKQVSLFYRIEKEAEIIELISFFDNRQNPEKRPT